MSLDSIHQNKHLHLWTKSIDGAEYANALYENEVDAALAFCGIIQNVRKYSKDGHTISIEDVMGSLVEGRGMYAGVPGLVVVLSKCDGKCKSPTWN